jgi:hypothetical protein
MNESVYITEEDRTKCSSLQRHDMLNSNVCYTYSKEYIPDNECKDQDHDNRGELHGIAAAAMTVGSGFSSWCSNKVVAS